MAWVESAREKTVGGDNHNLTDSRQPQILDWNISGAAFLWRFQLVDIVRQFRLDPVSDRPNVLALSPLTVMLSYKLPSLSLSIFPN